MQSPGPNNSCFSGRVAQLRLNRHPRAEKIQAGLLNGLQTRTSEHPSISVGGAIASETVVGGIH